MDKILERDYGKGVGPGPVQVLSFSESPEGSE